MSELLSSKIDHSFVLHMLRVLVLSPEALTGVISHLAICLRVVYKQSEMEGIIIIITATTDNYDIDFCSWV